MTSTLDSRTGTAAAVSAGPRSVPRRRMQWNRLSLGVATVAVGALIGGLLYVRSQPHTYVAVAQAIPIGHRITAADLRVVRISTDAGITPIPASQISAVVGKTAQVDLEPGSLLVPADLTDKAVPAPGQQLVPLGIDIDRMPNQLGAGDSVVLVVTPDGTIVSGDDTTATV